MKVGVRDLRDGLSRHLAAVRGGQTITVTDHGKPIARIVPIEAPTALERLIAEGRVTPATRSKQPSMEPIATSGPVGDFVDEQRR